MAASPESSARRYRISALLNKGSSGRVYRAVLEEPDGQEVDIALKLLRDEDVSSLTLPRLREEARLVSQVQDRAIVKLDPPIRLAPLERGRNAPGERWALVMDLVTGVSLQRLTSLGAMPPLVVCEIVQEVARVLDKVWMAPGPDGQPLRIMHRDVKPSNIQLNSAGKIWVLDFGIAKADYKSRDAQTTAFATGTRGFIAPERLEGVDSPAGDVFSLGVTAQTLLGNDDSSPALLELIGRMRALDPDERPTAGEIADQCARLRRRMEGVPLREWAERNVNKAIAVRFSDEFVGKVLVETASPRPGGRSRDSVDPGAASRSLSARSPRSLAPPSMAPESAPRARPSVPPESSRSAGVRSREEPRRESPQPESAPRAKSKSTPVTLSKPPRDPGLTGLSKAVVDPPSQTPAPRESAPARSLPSSFGFDTSSVPAFPNKKKGKDDDDDTVVLPSDDYASMLETVLPPPRAGSDTSLPPRVPQSPRSLAPQSPLDPVRGLDPIRPLEPEPQPEPSKKRRPGLVLGMAGASVLGLSILLTFGVLGAVGLWWMWPEPAAVRSLKPPRRDIPHVLKVGTVPHIPVPDEQHLTFSSIPLGVDVYLDRKLIGRTPVVELPVPPGEHEVILVSDFEKLVRKIQVGKKKPRRFVWKGGEIWEEHL